MPKHRLLVRAVLAADVVAGTLAVAAALGAGEGGAVVLEIGPAEEVEVEPSGNRSGNWIWLTRWWADGVL
ncbi:MAG: hypothetical protein M1830_010444 [Pleopsidium flavum]|nr:MAG: hypothetical protein M1830_010444 [Pleopsidium flavum]